MPTAVSLLTRGLHAGRPPKVRLICSNDCAHKSSWCASRKLARAFSPPPCVRSPGRPRYRSGSGCQPRAGPLPPPCRATETIAIQREEASEHGGGSRRQATVSRGIAWVIGRRKQRLQLDIRDRQETADLNMVKETPRPAPKAKSQPYQYSHSMPIPTAERPSAPTSPCTRRRRVTPMSIETALCSRVAPVLTPTLTLSEM
jgi:hypothetical protein